MLFFFFFKQKTAYEMRISDWSSDVCSSDLARACGVSRTIFMERFRASAGVPPATYVFDWRMRLATSLLETTDASVERIAHQMGYSSEIGRASCRERVCQYV